MIIETLTSPVILFFALGMLAGFARSDLAIPEAFAKAMAIYLMAAIGLKGGVSVAETGITVALALAAATGVVLSFLIPLPAFGLLRSVGRLDRTTAAAVAAHYGSVSLVTFITANEMLKGIGLAVPGYMAAVLALMETPAIITGLWLARSRVEAPVLGEAARSSLLHEVLLNASVVLLVGAFVIGLVAGKDGFAPIAPVFEGGYRGVLCLFLLDMGLLAARRLSQTKALNRRLVALAVLLPVMNGVVAVLLANAIGLEPPVAATLGILAASASYIAVPAAMRLALPEADPGIYLSMSLGITFPFNIVVGIPLLASLAGLVG
ncbi:sodium-dependent bicarbonate transport family permease [Sphingomonas arenae]|uniref:sodium-dependent bicarbonate transport family permease n=1 Tax=Sphingomonas arenae TaxID=2812555 RepID=UPI0019685912|nr:sodium-dependent bicarbonate transport family permease [Sphingomonas arenae]